MNNLLRHWALGPRLAAVFAILMLVVALQAAFSIYSAFSTDRHIDTVTAAKAEQSAALQLARETMLESASNTSQYLLLLDFPQAEEFRKFVEQSRQRSGDASGKLLAVAQELDAKQQLDQFKAAKERFDKLQQRVLDLTSKNKNEEAVGLWARDGHASIERQRKAADVLAQRFQASHEVSLALIDARNRNTIIANGAALALALLLTVALGVGLQRSITQPLAQAVAASEALARGDLRHRCPTDSREDEPARLLRALAQAGTQLQTVVGRIAAAAHSVRGAAGEIASGNQDLSDRTEQQANQLQRAVSSIAQLADTFSSNAGNARQASQSAAATAQAASGGGAVVTQAVQQMEEIHTQSRRIKDIIGAIDGIAFQTNILALNAAVEAARAGEQGRGFAVVAAEVRQLAQRSAQAAREIGNLISESVERVDAGSGLVKRAGSTIGQVVEQVQQVASLMSQMADSAAQQSDGIGSVNHMLGELDAMTQRNAALVEESAAAASTLRSLSDELSQSVAAFNLTESSSAEALPA